MSQIDGNPRQHPEFGPGTVFVQEHGRRILHLEGENRGEPLCGHQRLRTHRLKFEDANDLFFCPLCAAIKAEEIDGSPAMTCSECLLEISDPDEEGRKLLDHVVDGHLLPTARELHR